MSLGTGTWVGRTQTRSSSLLPSIRSTKSAASITLHPTNLKNIAFCYFLPQIFCQTQLLGVHAVPGPPQNIWVRKEGEPQKNPALLLPPFSLQEAEFHQPVQFHEPETQGPAAASSNPGTKRGSCSPSLQLKYLKTGNHKSFPAKQLYLLI